MLEYEHQMARYELVGNELQHVAPTLLPNEKELILEFHNESSFHAFEHTSSVWYVLVLIYLQYTIYYSTVSCYRLHSTEQIMLKISRGRIIHPSEFIEPENGGLVVLDKDGEVIKEAQQIIYPGSNRDAWWDCEQLIEQVKNKAILVFEEAHLGCQALFTFDQLSAHAALPPDALKAFEMNLSNGGAQRRQKDTIIPNSNPFPEYHGWVQKMTTENGEQKGLQQTLEERGFDVRKLHAKSSPVCPFENNNCCMACLLSKQEDFTNQVSMLETVIQEAGHECISCPNFIVNSIPLRW
jgi:hypothetical protein